jgi:hypothetical protein
LNPNVGFQHVECVAAEKIGVETVASVANILKYYVADSSWRKRRRKRWRRRHRRSSGSATTETISD